jgi:hypothetical protein
MNDEWENICAFVVLSLCVLCGKKIASRSLAMTEGKKWTKVYTFLIINPVEMLKSGQK